jgi:hypothetical protein
MNNPPPRGSEHTKSNHARASSSSSASVRGSQGRLLKIQFPMFSGDDSVKAILICM